jgi:hypothetical protein
MEVKMRNLILLGVGLISLVFISAPAMAQEYPFQLALVTPIQIFSENSSITGVRIDLIYGRNTTVKGLDWGFINHTTSGTSLGIGLGVVNLTDANFTGLQYGWVNWTKGNFEGMQWGLINHAGYANGFQLGFINHADRLKGLQIGFINIIKQGGQFPVFPIVNWSF